MLRPLPAVGADTAGCLEPAGRVGQVRPWGLEEELIVVRHEAEGVEHEAEPPDGFFQGIEKSQPIVIVAVDFALLVAAGGDVEEGISNSARGGLAMSATVPVCRASVCTASVKSQGLSPVPVPCSIAFSLQNVVK